MHIKVVKKIKKKKKNTGCPVTFKVQINMLKTRLVIYLNLRCRWTSMSWAACCTHCPVLALHIQHGVRFYLTSWDVFFPLGFVYIEICQFAFKEKTSQTGKFSFFFLQPHQLFRM